MSPYENDFSKHREVVANIQRADVYIVFVFFGGEGEIWGGPVGISLVCRYEGPQNMVPIAKLSFNYNKDQN